MMLTSNRLKYSKFKEEDFQDYYDLVSKDEVMRYTTGKAYKLDEAKTKFQKVLKLNEEFSEIGVFSVRIIETNEYIGIAKVTYIKDGEAEIGYSFIPKFWGVGFGTEATTRMIELAKNTAYVKRLMAIVDPEHKASIRILTKHGLTLSEITTWENLPAHFYRIEL